MKNLFLLCLLFLCFPSISRLNASGFEDKPMGASFALSSFEFFPAFSGPLLGLDDTLKFTTNDCGAAFDICIDIPIAEISNYQINNNGLPYANGIAGCNFDTLNLYNYTSLFGQGALGPYILQSWMINGTNYTATFNSINELLDSLNSWDPTGDWTHDDPNNEISGGTPGNTYSDMVIWSVIINASTILTRMDDISTLGTSLNFGVGNHRVIVTDNLNGTSDTVVVQIACINPETIQLNVLVGDSETICLNFDELLGDVNSVTNLCSGSNVQFQLINGDSCVEITGLQVGIDTACFEVCDIFGFCDTTYLIVNSNPLAGIHEFYDTVFVAESNTFCINTSVFPGTPTTITNICPGNSGTYASFTLDVNNFCVDYTGLTSGGTDLACIVVCDDTNVCDTTIIYLTVRRQGPAIFMDTIFINETASFCGFDTTNLDGTIVSIINDCPGLSGGSVFFDLDLSSLCVNYEGIGTGKDTACILILDDLGNVDTTYMYVCVVPPPPSILYDVIRLGLTVEYCIDTTQLFGDIVSIANICPGSSGTNVSFTINSTTFCIEAEALSIGTDTACIVICDDLGVCDTSIFIITVEEDLDIPIALDDFDSIEINTELQIDVCANDTIPPNLPLTNFFVLPLSLGGVGPSNGSALSNNECTITYVPENDFCGADSLSYVICNMMGCDTATVVVSITCPSGDLKIFNAFSPNGDGVGDTFRINGLENFPNHELFIYSRWGTLVFSTKNYLSDWEGRWEGNDLPDGTYFYVLDDGAGNVHSGYVFIQR